MRKYFKEWLDINRPLSGTAYVLIGLGAFAVKFTVDHLFAAYAFHHPWQLGDYWRSGNAFYLWGLRKEDALFFSAMLTLALPFIALGVVMTLRRLKTLRLPLGWVFAFFIPYLNLPFFALLSMSPAPAKPVAPQPRPPKSGVLASLIPASGWASCLVAALLTALLTTAVVGVDTMVLKRYGWGLFVLLPFVHGMATAWLYGYHRPRSLAECQLAASASSLMISVLLLFSRIEGAICILMAAPLWLVLVLMGAWVGWGIQQGRWRSANGPQFMLLCLVAVPLLMGAEYAIPPKAPLLKVCSAVIIQAPPDQVWEHVIAFSELPPPKEWIFHTGLAYPIRARIRGSGPGALRRCEFSTGAFLEPIKIWNKPSLLRFGVTKNPPPMQEMSLYSHLDPPHLHGFLVSRQGQFLLTPTPDGGTRLEGTTWYEHNLWPATYWQLWSDYIIHRIHLRVLQHIKMLSEEDARKGILHG